MTSSAGANLLGCVDRRGIILLVLITPLITINALLYYSGFFSVEDYLWNMKLVLVTLCVGCAYVFSSAEEGLLNPYNLFLFCFLLFLVSRVLMDLLGQGDFSNDTTFTTTTFGLTTQIATIWQLVCGLLGFLIGFCLVFRSLKYSRRDEKTRFDSFVERNFYTLFAASIFVFGLVIAFKSTTLLFVLTEGYGALQRGEFGTKPLPVFIAEGAFWFLSFTILAAKGSRQIKAAVLLMILSVLFTDLISGYRGKVMSVTLMLLWFGEWRGTFKLSFFRLLVFLVFFVWLMIFINEIRQGRDFADYDLALYGQAFKVFFWVQGFSVHVVSYSNEMYSALREQFGFINIFAIITAQLDKLRYVVFGGGPFDLEYLRTTHGYSNYVISHAVDSRNFSNGFTMGTVYIAELNLLGGWIFVFLASVLLGMLFTICYEKLKHSAFGVSLILMIYPELIYLPRNTLIIFVNNNLIEILLTLFLGVFILVAPKRTHRQRPQRLSF